MESAEMRICYGILGSLIALSICRGASGQPCESWVEGDAPPGLSYKIHSAALWDADGDGPETASLVVSLDPGTFGQWRVLRWTGDGWTALGGRLMGSWPGLELASWDPDGAGPEPAKLIAGGGFIAVEEVPTNRIAWWDGETWQQVGEGLPHPVTSLITCDPDGPGPLTDWLLASGSFGVRRWDGSAWTAFEGVGGFVTTAVRWDPDGEGPLGEQLVLGGSSVARYDGAAWHHFTTGMSQGAVTSLAVWDQDGDGPGAATLVAGGTFIVDGTPTTRSVAMWDGTAWVGMDGGLGTNFRWNVYSLAAFDPDGEGPLGPELVAAGDFSTTRHGELLYRVARWDGAAWRPMNDGLAGGQTSGISPIGRRFIPLDQGVNGLGNSGVVLVGDFTKTGDLSAGNIAVWTGEAWRAISAGFGASNGRVPFAFGPGTIRSMVEWDDDGDAQTPPVLIALGSFTVVNSKLVSNLARWDGSAWEPFEPGLPLAGREIAVLDLDGDGPEPPQLIAACAPTTTNPAPTGTIHRFTDEGWVQIGGWFNQPVHSMIMWDPDGDGPLPAEFVVGGEFTSVAAYPVHHIARWNGSLWEPLGDDVVLSGVTGPVTSLATWDPDGDGPGLARLVAAGSFTAAGGVEMDPVATWDGSSWSALSAPALNVTDTVVTVWPTEPVPLLLAAGRFQFDDGPLQPGLAAWDGSMWTLMGAVTGPIAPRVTAFGRWDHDGDGPAGESLVVGGRFESIGGVAASGSARWDGTDWHPIGTNGISHWTAAINAVKHGRGDGGPDDLMFAVYPAFSSQPDSLQSPVMLYTNTGLPSISSQPADMIAEVGAEASFTVSVTGEGPLAYRWRRDGQDLSDGPSAGGGVISGAATPTLTISNARLADSGEYGVVISGECGERASSVARLFVRCSADWDHNASVNSSDISAYLTAWLADVQGGGTGADFDGDGAVNSTDISAFLTAWLAAVQGGC